MTHTARVMKGVSAVALVCTLALMVYGIFTPGARWLLALGFVLTISVSFSSLGFWATQDLDKEAPAGTSPQAHNFMPKDQHRAA